MDEKVLEEIIRLFGSYGRFRTIKAIAVFKQTINGMIELSPGD